MEQLKFYSYAKLKISDNNVNININNGVLQGSLISPILFNLYIKVLLKKLANETYETLAYADDLCILAEGYNQLVNTIKIIDNWTKVNWINVNKKKSGIMVVKGNEERNEIDDYPIINEYKYLGITIIYKVK